MPDSAAPNFTISISFEREIKLQLGLEHDGLPAYTLWRVNYSDDRSTNCQKTLKQHENVGGCD